MLLRYAHKHKVAMLGNVACFLPAVFSLQKIQAEFQTVWILIMSHSHMHRLTARASSLPLVCETIASMEGKRA